MKSSQFEVRCLMCGAEAGLIVNGRFWPHAGCPDPLPRRRGLPRCCRCGGSLYTEPLDTTLTPVDRDQLRRMAANNKA